MSVLILLLSYIYQPEHWQNFPRMGEIKNFTADAFNTAYVVTKDAIIELNPFSHLPQRTFSSSEGLPDDLSLTIFDPYTNKFWLVTDDGYLFSFQPSGRITTRITVGPYTGIQQIGINQTHIFIHHPPETTAVGKQSRQEEEIAPGDDISWVGGFDPVSFRRDYPLLHPWVLDDPACPMIPFSQVFSHRHNAYVAVPGYGYLVYDELSWREGLRYQSPQAEGVHSIISADSSIYAFGRNGVDQVVLDSDRLVYRDFSRWGTTLTPQPTWSRGISDKLRRINFDRVQLMGDNLFLVDNNEAIVFNVPERTISKLTSVDYIYDLDYRYDSLLVATDDGVFLTVISDSSIEPQPLIDARSKLYRSDVLAIVAGEHARYFWTGWAVVKQSGEGWEYFPTPGFMPVPQKDVTGRDSLIILGGNGGVTIYNPETYYQIFLTTEEGLLSDNVTAVQVVDNYLWIASDAGLQRFDLSAVLY